MITPLSVAPTEKRIDSEFYVEGYATTFDLPYLLFEIGGEKYYERVDSGVLNGADMSRALMLYDHGGRVLARTSNGSLIIEPDDEGIFVAADLSLSNAARELYAEIHAGLVTKMSWSFRIDDYAFDKATRTTTINKVSDVYDVSAVSFPANDGANIKARSYFIARAETETRERRKSIIKILSEV